MRGGPICKPASWASPFPARRASAKLTGQARYIDDLSLPGMIFGATVRSSIARGAIEEIQFGEGIAWHEFTIVTAKDIPGRNVVSLIMDDQPCLADGVVNHPEEPILLLAHPDRHALAAAVAAVNICYKPAPSIHTIEESERREQIIWGKDNIFKSYRMEKGDVDQAWKDAAWIVEGEYSTGAQEQLYIEPNGVIAQAGDTGGLTVWGSMQCPFYVHKALVALTGLPAESVRVVQAETGGAFGGKEEYPSMIAGHAALLAMKSGRPVKIIYDRMEDMAATTKRHPSRTRHRTAVSADGKLLAAEIEFVTDGGAYATLSSTVLSRGTIHAGGPYFWPNIRVNSKAYATNTPPHGAFRGFGAPQSLFALERHMDHVAKTIGLAPDEFRRRNLLRQGMTTATNQVIHDPIVMDQMLDRALELTDYHAKVEQFAAHNLTSTQEERHRHRRLSARRRLYRFRGTLSQCAGGPGSNGSRRPARAGVEHRVRPGNQHHSLPDCRGDAGPGVRRRQHGPGRYQHQPQQRAHRGLAHGDDHRQDCADRGFEDAANADR